MRMTRGSIVALGASLLVAAIAVGFRYTGAMSVLSAGASSVRSADPAPVAKIAQGTGVTIQFSDKPAPLPAVEVTDLDGRALSPADWRGKAGREGDRRQRALARRPAVRGAWR